MPGEARSLAAVPEQAAVAGTPIDHDLVAVLRAQVLELLMQDRRGRGVAGEERLTEAHERMLGNSLISRVLQEYRADQLRSGEALPPADEDAALAEAVQNAVFGLGRMTPLLADPTLSEINITGCDTVWLIKLDGTKVRGEPVARDDEELIRWVRSIATYGQLNSRSWDPTNPVLRCRMPDGSRLSAIMGACERPVVSIRMLRRPRVTLQELRDLGTFDDSVELFLRSAVSARMNFLLSGATHSGKTTLLRALTHAIPPEERIVTIERFRELGLGEQLDLHPDVVELEEQPANNEGEGGQSLADLVHFSRSLDADRLLVGECLGDEIVALLDGMTQGDDGGFTTIHARSAREVPNRVAGYAHKAGLPTEQALLQMSNAVDFVVHMSAVRTSSGALRRYISSIVEIGGFDGTQVITSEIFGVAPGESAPAWQSPLTERRRELLEEYGFNWAYARGELS